MQVPRVAFVVMFAVLSLVAGCRQRGVEVPAPVAPAEPAAPNVETSRLVGNWERPDGGYVLKIRAATGDGKLDAGYFNPNPIHVAQATWSRGADQALAVFVELRDVNYPGATYTLRYRPDSDVMTGLYHQPKMGQTFEIEFHRLP